MSWEYDHTDRVLDEDFLVRAKPGGLSRRIYNLLIGGIVTASLVIIGLMYAYFDTVPGAMNFMLDPAVCIGCIILPFVGILVMFIGKGRDSIPMMIVGYGIMTLTLGLPVAWASAEYTALSVLNAVVATAVITATFATLGFIRPDIFRQLYVVCFWGLTAMIIIELVMLLFGVHHTWQDWVVIAIFCGFIGYDFYNAANDEPTVDNAIIYACDIFLDIVNVFLRILNIAGERKR